MKVLIGLCVLVFVAVSYSKPHSSRGCLYILGNCYKECEEGTHAYTTGCGPKTPEATCDNPTPQAEKAIICDYSACYCDPPTVRDTASGKCVRREECPKKA
ncbi:serine protease inhibitor 3 isoform X1 [Helicoverpa armigera]|uniref:serine protease inhibitor 3 isoform X1 n=1 Tax=Helicoverpa armigera TaxID=29058 RepID=UPI003083A00E